MGKITREIGLELCGLRLREAEDGQESRVIEGHAAVFGQRSVNLVPWKSTLEIYEVLEPGCIDNELINRSDVVLTAYHNNEKILGRSVNGKGTLELSIDNKGLAIRCELPNTHTADEMLESIKRGDVTGMSFAYTADEEDNENGVSYENTGKKSAEGKEIWIRHVKKCNGLYDVTIAGHPAYPQTDVKQREVGEEMLKRIDSEAVSGNEPEVPQSTGNSAQVVREIGWILEEMGSKE